MATITEAEVITEATAKNLTLVTDVDALPVKDSMIVLEFTADDYDDAPVSMSYDDLTNTTIVDGLILQAATWSGQVEELKTTIAAINTTLAALVIPHTYAEWQNTINSLLEIRALLARY